MVLKKWVKPSVLVFFLLVFIVGFINFLDKSKTPEKLTIVPSSVSVTPTSTDTFVPNSSPSISPKPDESVLLDENRPAKFRTAEAQKLKVALPPQVFLRDYVALPNERGYLALYVVSPQLDVFPGIDKNGDGIITIDEKELSCPSDDYGQQLEGAYYLGLVRAGKLVNAVPMPYSEYRSNKPVFRQLRSVLDGTWADDSASVDSEIIEPQILKLEDLTGDGVANEISLMVGYLSCGNNLYAIGGYDKYSDKAVFYNFLKDGVETKTHHNFYPASDGSVLYKSGCDHGAGEEEWVRFVFDEMKNLFVKQSSQTATCMYWPEMYDEKSTWVDLPWTGEIVGTQWDLSYVIKNETSISKNKYPYFVAEWPTAQHPKYKQKVRITGNILSGALGCKEYDEPANDKCMPWILVKKAEQL